MNLTELNIGDKAKILSLQKIEENFKRRLMDLGIYESASVILLNRLAFGKLFLIEVDEIEICLREEDAKLVEVDR
jgi:ferrous iron transport protein A